LKGIHHPIQASFISANNPNKLEITYCDNGIRDARLACRAEAGAMTVSQRPDNGSDMKNGTHDEAKHCLVAADLQR